MTLIKHQIIEIAFVDRHLIRKSCLLNVYGSDYLLFGSAMIHMFVLLGPIAWYKYIYNFTKVQASEKKSSFYCGSSVSYGPKL